MGKEMALILDRHAGDIDWRQLFGPTRNLGCYVTGAKPKTGTTILHCQEFVVDMRVLFRLACQNGVVS